MVKKVLVFLAFLFVFSMGSIGVSAAEDETNQYPSKKDIETLNQELDVLVDKANKKLANGEENFELSSKNLKLGINQQEMTKFNTLDGPTKISTSSIGSKSYQAYIANTSGWNFTHAVSGVFSWDGDYLTGVTKNADLTGKLYGKSDNTYVEGLDGRVGSTAKLARVTSKGTFTALKYLPITYHTTLIVDVQAPTQSYRIVDAYIQ